MWHLRHLGIKKWAGSFYIRPVYTKFAIWLWISGNLVLFSRPRSASLRRRL